MTEPFVGYDPLQAGPFKNLFVDKLGEPGKAAVGSGPETWKTPAKLESYMRGEENMVFFPIDDPRWQGKWGSGPLNIELDPIDMTDKPITCEDVWSAKAEIRRENCELLRERGEDEHKKQGCPSRVIAIPDARKCFGTKKPAPKKTTTATKKATTTKKK